MILMLLSCNGSDCPWFGRGPICLHPRAPMLGVAERMVSGTPHACPVRRDVQVLTCCSDQESVKAAIAELQEWIRLQKIAESDPSPA